MFNRSFPVNFNQPKPFGKDEDIFSNWPNGNLEKEKTLEKKADDRESVDRLIKSSNRCIISISSSYPGNFFPNTINVEEGRVTFIFRQFLSSQSHSVDIKDISNVFIESSIFRATLQIVSKTFIQNDIKIGGLNKKDAIQARTIIEGLRIFAAHGIDTSSYEINELIAKIWEMHSSQGGHIA